MNVYAEIARLDDLKQDEKDELFAYFATNPSVKQEVLDALPECTDDISRVRFLRRILLQATPVNISKVNTELVHVFVDNSNLYVEAKYSVGQLEKIYDRVKIFNEATNVEEYHQVYYMKSLRIDYGCLLTTILSGRSMGSSPIIVGSRPPPDDTPWNKIKDLGYEVKDPGVLVLVAGDGDYEPALEEILKAGWKVEIRFWASAISHHLKSPDITRKDKELKISYKPLDSEYRNFTYCVGPDLTKKKSIFRIERDDINRVWKSEEIMKCYTELQLFCWWYKTDDGGLELYFNSKAQLERAGRWMKKNFPNINAWKIQ
ncbi:8060_t:CDS:2, partial [Paraglomus occultum]